MQLDLLAADLDASGDGQRLDLAEAQRRRALDVVLLVELAQLALGGARLAGQAGGGRLRDAERSSGEGEPAEDVVPVAVGCEQAAGGEAGLLQDGRQDLELVRVDGRVDDEALVAGADRRARRLVDARGDDEDVRMERDDAQRD